MSDSGVKLTAWPRPGWSSHFCLQHQIGFGPGFAKRLFTLPRLWALAVAASLFNPSRLRISPLLKMQLIEVQPPARILREHLAMAEGGSWGALSRGGCSTPTPFLSPLYPPALAERNAGHHHSPAAPHDCPAAPIPAPPVLFLPLQA